MSPAMLAEGQRSLAAILFTDTVDFSALMSKDEDRARRLVARDMGAMRLACGRYDGQVLKSTGDGLLMLFSSAVQAVSCALEIQAHIRDQGRELPAAERLRHRIGIHLGDVIRDHDDVMGDGVNIASRLQAEGMPGGVCISNTVFEVVQNRVPFYVVSRKARKLKNVGTVVAFQISQRSGGNRYLHQAWDWVVFRRRRLFRIAAILVVVGTVAYCNTKVELPEHDELKTGATQLNPLGSRDVMASLINESEADDDDDADNGAAPSKVIPSGKLKPGVELATNEDFYVERFNAMKVYDFAAMRGWLDKHDCPVADDAKLSRIALTLEDLFAWCYGQLPAYSNVHPLVVHTGDQDLEFWAAPNGGVTCKAHGVALTMARNEVPPPIMVELAKGLIQAGQTSGHTQTVYLWRGLEYFISAYAVEVPHKVKKEIDHGVRYGD